MSNEKNVTDAGPTATVLFLLAFLLIGAGIILGILNFVKSIF